MCQDLLRFVFIACTPDHSYRPSTAAACMQHRCAPCAKPSGGCPARDGAEGVTTAFPYFGDRRDTSYHTWNKIICLADLAALPGVRVRIDQLQRKI